MSRTDLSFAEVKDAGRFSWHPEGYIYQDGRLLRIICLAMSGDNVKTAEVKRSTLTGTEPLIHRGWRHLDDCDCPHCQAHDPQRPDGDSQ